MLILKCQLLFVSRVSVIWTKVMPFSCNLSRWTYLYFMEGRKLTLPFVLNCSPRNETYQKHIAPAVRVIGRSPLSQWIPTGNPLWLWRACSGKSETHKVVMGCPPLKITVQRPSHTVQWRGYVFVCFFKKSCKKTRRKLSIINVPLFVGFYRAPWSGLMISQSSYTSCSLPSNQ